MRRVMQMSIWTRYVTYMNASYHIAPDHYKCERVMSHTWANGRVVIHMWIRHVTLPQTTTTVPYASPNPTHPAKRAAKHIDGHTHHTRARATHKQIHRDGDGDGDGDGDRDGDTNGERDRETYKHVQTHKCMHRNRDRDRETLAGGERRSEGERALARGSEGERHLDGGRNGARESARAQEGVRESETLAGRGKEPDARPLSLLIFSAAITCSTHMCDMTHVYERHDSFTCATRLIYMCDKTPLLVRQDSFICTTWLIHICDMTHW